MEDKYTDKKTVDQAWDAMSSILEKEMPVTEKGPRFSMLPFLFGTALLLGFSFVIGLSLLPSDSMEEEPSNPMQRSTVREIAFGNSHNFKTNESAVEMGDIWNTKDKISKTEQEESIKTSAIRTKPNQQISFEPKSTSASFQANNQSIVGKSKNMQPKEDAKKASSFNLANADFRKKLPTNIKKGVDRNQELVVASAAGSLHIANAKSEFVPAPVLSGLSSVVNFTIGKLSNTKSIHPDSHANKTKLKNLHWAINLHGTQRIRESNNEFFLSSKGKSAGFEVLLSKKINKKWSIGSGLGYKFSASTVGQGSSSNLHWGAQTSEATLGMSDFNLISNFNGNGAFDPTSSINMISGSDIIFVARRTQFISVPIFVERTISARWSLEAGIRFNQKIGDFGTRFLSDSRKSNVDFFLLPSYKLSKHLSIGLMLQHSTNQFNHDRTIVTKETGRNQIGISVRARI